jgi:molybdopterin-guanine dinucleotide biosynthesis protein A
MLPALVVLAGGRAERMGGIVKGHLLRRDGRMILAALHADLAPHVSSIALVATAEKHAQIALPEGVLRLSDEGEGPAAALMVAAGALTAPWLLVVGADQARASPLAVRWLLGALRADDDAVVAEVDGQREPLLALYRRTALLGLGGEQRGGSLMRLLDALGARALAPPPELIEAFGSVNTWVEAEAERGPQTP